MSTARRMYEVRGFRLDQELPARLGVRYWRNIYSLEEGEEVQPLGEVT